jgi:hypothetical protein
MFNHRLVYPIVTVCWFHNVLTHNEDVIDCCTIFSLKIHLNQNKNLHENLGAFLMLLKNEYDLMKVI